ncbi:MAG: membrane dipeptidase, partial [Gemmatimonadota bacterium]|nr:membrane dipeptidase [Gemmatimonadota bacterium]
MKTFRFRYIIIFSALVAASLNCSSKTDKEDFLARAKEIHRRILTLDSHVDIPTNYATGELDPGVRNEKLQVDLVKMEQGGMDCVFLIAFSPQGPLTGEGYQAAQQEAGARIEAIHRLCEQMYPGRIELAASPDDLRRIRASGKKAAVIGMENGYPLAADLALVKKYYGLGVRYITLCHNGHNDICDSANPPNKPWPAEDDLDDTGRQLLVALYRLQLATLKDLEPRHGGLSEFGRHVVAEMNRLGIMVEVSITSLKEALPRCETSTIIPRRF